MGVQVRSSRKMLRRFPGVPLAAIQDAQVVVENGGIHRALQFGFHIGDKRCFSFP